MSSCASATGIPLPVLRSAKRAGCPAFDQANRVHLAPLLAWLFATDSAELGADWHQRYKRAQALGMEQRTAAERGDLLDAHVFCEELQRGVLAMKTAIFHIIEASPPKFAAAGEDVAANREVLRPLMWDAFTQFRDVVLPYIEKAQTHTDRAVHTILNPQPTTKQTYENQKTKTPKTPVARRAS